MYRNILNALLPPGSIWVPEEYGDLDNLFDGIANNAEQIHDFLFGLSRLRNPLLTSVLSDLEKEYGIIPDETIDETIRRERLLSVKTAVNGDGSADFLQTKLRESGFDVYVHLNNPPINPDLFLYTSPAAICGNQFAICGYETALCGGQRGELVVNGPVYEHIFFTGVIAGGLFAVCGNEEAICRDEGDFSQREIEYEVPTDSKYWPLIFFVGGEDERAPDGSLINIETADIPICRRDEFIRLIVKYKPMIAWGGLIVRYI